MKIERIDHIVLTVYDVEKTCEFYAQILGMQVITFGAGRKALAFGEQKINLHQVGKEFEPKARNPTSGAADLCFVTQSMLESVVKHLRLHNVEIECGPVQRTGALGAIESVYVRDPDGNLIEISHYIE